MSFSRVFGATLIGLEVHKVVVEVDIYKRAVQPSVNIVGLPGTSVNESIHRVKSAITNCGFTFPRGRITVNLAPAYIKKDGSLLDLPIAVAILKSQGIIQSEIENFLMLGELSLNGEVRRVKGVLPISYKVKNSFSSIKSLIVPFGNGKEAAIVDGIKIFEVKNLKQLVNFLNGQEVLIFPKFEEKSVDFIDKNVDFSDVKGQHSVKRALEIAAAGSHNLIMNGSPGSGKSMLAKRFYTILPPMTKKESIETSMIYSLAGLLDENYPLLSHRPVRFVHHTASVVSIIGGGSNAKPGEITLSHNGVLIFDEIVEFPRSVLESLRQPMEDKKITISRSKYSVTYPANFILLGTRNPCPCGWYGDDEHQCTCTINEIIKYNKKLSGPIMDRIDLYIEVSRLKSQEFIQDYKEESSESVRQRVVKARKIQELRFKDLPIHSNSEMSQKQIKEFCKFDSKAQKVFLSGVDKLKLTARGMNSTIKIARTIADLDSSESIKPEHILEAFQYRYKEVTFNL
jgi:magnesium chelatase family protein